MTAILRLQLDDKDPVRVNSAINQLAEYIDRNPVPVPSASRTLLTASTTFYVATTGSDANPGTVGSPFLTIQHAYDVIVRTIDTAGFTVTISCASGTYTAGLNLSTSWSGGGVLVLDFGGGTISSGSSNCVTVSCLLPNTLRIQNGTLTTSGAVASCIAHTGTGTVLLGTGLTFGAAGSMHLSATGAGAKIILSSAYTITGGATAHYFVPQAGNAITGNGGTVTITGTIAITYFAYAEQLANIYIVGFTFPGSTPTGTRYYCSSNSVIFTGGGGANYFPGTIAGILNPGALYI